MSWERIILIKYQQNISGYATTIIIVFILMRETTIRDYNLVTIKEVLLNIVYSECIKYGRPSTI